MSKLTAKKILLFPFLKIISVISIFIKPDAVFDGFKIYNNSNIAWVLAAIALVFLMTPGLAFFYSGLVKRKNALSAMSKSFVLYPVYRNSNCIDL